MNAVEPATSAPEVPKTKRPRSHTIDFMRVVLFSCVVLVHTVGAINQTPDIVRQMSLLALAMHYTRYGFVFVTVFVLFLGYYRKDTDAVTFWRRRFGLVVAPYLVWSVFYSLWGVLVQRSADTPFPGWSNVAKETVLDVFQGDAKYQLYFLLISMQIYFFFPMLRWVVQKTEGHHGKLFAAGAFVQIGMMFWLQGVDEVPWLLSGASYPEGSLLDLVQYHGWKLLPTYALLATVGALAAVHFDRVHAWLMGHVRLLIPLILLGAAITFGFYWYRTRPGGVSPFAADSAVDPTLIPWLLGSITGLYLIAAKWNARRGDGSGVVARIVDLGSVRAFGVFAAHPMVIDALLLSGMGTWLFGTFDGFTGAVLVRGLLLVAATFVGSLLVVEILLRSPLAKTFVARDRLPLRKPKPVEKSSPA